MMPFYFSKKGLKLRSLLMIVMLLLLFLPISSQYFFRVYDNHQLQKTEIELISQSAVLAAIYRLLLTEYQNKPLIYPNIQSKNYYHPIQPLLDLSHNSVLPRRPKAIKTNQVIDKMVLKTGKKMQSIIIETQRITLAGIRILDQHGTVIAGRHEVGLSLAHIKEVKAALNGQYQAVIRERLSDEPAPPLASISRGAHIRAFSALPIMQNKQVIGVVYLSRTPLNIAKYLYASKLKILSLSLFVLTIAILFIYFISGFIAQPIKELTEQVRKVSQGEIETIQLSKQPSTYELAELAQSFVKMSQTLQQRSTYIRDFAAHVSHEFKTPLTAIQGALELLQDHADEMSDQQKQKFFNNILADTRRLEKLVQRLLELARADAMQPSSDCSDLNKVLTHCQAIYAERQLEIQFNNKESQLYLKISPDSLQTIFMNLAENSLQHGANQINIEFLIKKKL